jgi:hypothetical protein
MVPDWPGGAAWVGGGDVVDESECECGCDQSQFMEAGLLSNAHSEHRNDLKVLSIRQVILLTLF